MRCCTGIGVPITWKDFDRLQGFSKGRKGLWKDIEVLIVDEVSMLSGEFLDALDQVLRVHRYGEASDEAPPFGGIQVRRLDFICGYQ